MVLNNGIGDNNNFRNNNNQNNYSSPSAKERFAKIGRPNYGLSGKRSPTKLTPVPDPVIGDNKRSGPFIPDPDYSPPGSPNVGLKSVLRSSSHYY